MTTILIADDHPMVRAGIRQFLEEDGSITAIGEAASGNATLERLRTDHWNLLLLDINMPDRSGLDILRYIRASHADTKVLVLSALPERQYAISALKAGAHGYLQKECTTQQLLKAIHAVLRGHRYLSDNLAEVLVSNFGEDGPEQPLHELLSEREFQIFCKLAGGRTVSSIADELFLSEKTVSTYRKRILDKMHMTTNADLTAYAVRQGIMQ